MGTRVVYVGIHDEVEVPVEPGSEQTIRCERGVPIELPDTLVFGRTVTEEIDGQIVERQTHGGLLDQPENWKAAGATSSTRRRRQRRKPTDNDDSNAGDTNDADETDDETATDPADTQE